MFSLDNIVDEKHEYRKIKDKKVKKIYNQYMNSYLYEKYENTKLYRLNNKIKDILLKIFDSDEFVLLIVFPFFATVGVFVFMMAIMPHMILKGFLFLLIPLLPSMLCVFGAVSTTGSKNICFKFITYFYKKIHYRIKGKETINLIVNKRLINKDEALYILDKYYNEDYLNFKNTQCNLSMGNFLELIDCLKKVKKSNSTTLKDNINILLYNYHLFDIKIDYEEKDKILKLFNNYSYFNENIENIKLEYLEIKNKYSELKDSLLVVGFNNLDFDIINEFGDFVNDIDNLSNFSDMENFNNLIIKLESFNENKKDYLLKVKEFNSLAKLVIEVSKKKKITKKLENDIEYMIENFNFIEINEFQKHKKIFLEMI